MINYKNLLSLTEDRLKKTRQKYFDLLMEDIDRTSECIILEENILKCYKTIKNLRKKFLDSVVTKNHIEEYKTKRVFTVRSIHNITGLNFSTIDSYLKELNNEKVSKQ